MRNELMNNVQPATPFVGRITDNTVVAASAKLDGYGSLTFLIATGTLADADATFAVTMQESATGAFGGEENAVAAGDMVGDLVSASFNFANDNASFKIGYRGLKEFVQLKITPANNAGNADLAIIPLRGHPASAPTANPPA